MDAVSAPEPINQGPTYNHKRHLLRALLPIAAVIIVVIVGLLLAGNSGNARASAKAYLLLDNPSQSKISLADATGKTLYSTSYLKYTSTNFEAASPKGEVLLSSDITGNGESYIYIANGKPVKLPDAAAKALRSAIVLKNTHRLVFTDENDIAYVTCAQTCKLMSVDLSNGQAKEVVDIGAKPFVPQLPSAYPLGISPDQKTIYIRTLQSNKLGNNAAGVYAYDLGKKKVSGSWSMSLNADYTPSLSPDAKKIVYRDIAGKASNVSVLDLKSGKVASASWSDGLLNDQPSLFTWSPDAKKIAFYSSKANALKQGQNPNADFNLAYYDVGTNKTASLQIIKDSSHNQIDSLNWLDDGNIVYGQETSSQAYDFSKASSQIYKQAISSKAVSKIGDLNGVLKQVIFY